MHPASGLTPLPRPLEQLGFYGVDGVCLTCPGVSVPALGSTTIANCSCPVISPSPSSQESPKRALSLALALSLSIPIARSLSLYISLCL